MFTVAVQSSVGVHSLRLLKLTPSETRWPGQDYSRISIFYCSIYGLGFYSVDTFFSHSVPRIYDVPL